jgi:hypothetical protein
MNTVLPCLRQSFGRQCGIKWEAATQGKKWQQCRAAGSMGESQPLDLGATSCVPATLVLDKILCFIVTIQVYFDAGDHLQTGGS